MRAVSDEFLAALEGSHTVIHRAELYKGNDLIMDDVPIIGGTVTDDSQAVIRRRASVALAPEDRVLAALASLVPSDGGLWPTGNEMRVYSGIRLVTGDELVSLGVFRISKPTAVETSDGITITIDGYDRSRSVSRARFTSPYVVAQGTNYATAIKDLILSRLPQMNADTDFLFMETNYTTPQIVLTMDDDPMGTALSMASSIGAELFFDGSGICVLRPEPDPLYDLPVATYSPEEAVLTSVARGLDDEQAYNGVVVVSENSELTEPIRSEAWDTNPNSPTYYDPDYPQDSLYGPVPYFITTQYITTQSQADDAAAANLARVLGVIENVSFDSVSNPAHESGDIIAVESPRVGASGINILDSLTINFGGAGVLMQGVTRKRRSS